MDPSPRTNDLSTLYAPEEISLRGRTGLTSQALGHLAEAWKALEALELSIGGELQRWDAESLMTARKGTQRAWLALSNLDRSLGAKRSRRQGDIES